MNPTMTVCELKEQRTGASPAQWIDVRSATEYASGHLPGAVNIPLDQLEARLHDLHAELPVVLICKSGQRACMAAALLAPYRDDLTVLEGGTAAWVKSGFPVVVNAKTRWSLERQVRLGAGMLVLLGVALGTALNAHWFYLSAFAGAGLTFAGLTDFCPMAILLGKMPWNQARQGQACGVEAEAPRCS